jgi:hypothetical protein
MEVGGQNHSPAALPHKRDLVNIVQEAGWVPRPVWNCAVNLAPTGIRSPTFQPVAGRNTDYAFQTRENTEYHKKIKHNLSPG